MSFILDALRKSENSRLRQDHPAIFAARTAAARSRLPIWALVLVTLLAMNLLLVAYVLWRDRDAPTPAASLQVEAPVAVTTTAAPAAASASLPAAAQTMGPPKTNLQATIPSPNAARAVVDGGAAPRTERPARSATRDDLLARGTNVPPTELNMHVYDADPRARFVLLNGQRLREGDASLEGLSVERITPEGVILRFGSASFAVNLQ
jgi:hypothetical protein